MRPTQIRGGLGVVLCLCMAHPCVVLASGDPGADRGTVLGSLSSYGAVRVGKVAVPRETTLFSGDAVFTDAGRAIAQYQQGDSILLSGNSAACFSSGQVQLTMGKMSFLAVSLDTPAFFASTLRLQPLTAGSAASVSLDRGKASLAVTDGTIRVVDPTGQSLASVAAGHSVVLRTASPTAAGPDGSAAAQTCPAPAETARKKASRAPIWWVAAGVSAAAATATVLEEKSNGTDNASGGSGAVSPSD